LFSLFALGFFPPSSCSFGTGPTNSAPCVGDVNSILNQQDLSYARRVFRLSFLEARDLDPEIPRFKCGRGPVFFSLPRRSRNLRNLPSWQGSLLFFLTGSCTPSTTPYLPSYHRHPSISNTFFLLFSSEYFRRHSVPGESIVPPLLWKQGYTISYPIPVVQNSQAVNDTS